MRSGPHWRSCAPTLSLSSLFSLAALEAGDVRDLVAAFRIPLLPASIRLPPSPARLSVSTAATALAKAVEKVSEETANRRRVGGGARWFGRLFEIVKGS